MVDKQLLPMEKATHSFEQYIELRGLSFVGVASIDWSYMFALNYEKLKELMTRDLRSTHEERSFPGCINPF